MVIAFMALARLESVEPLRTCAPGESGKRLGLDRIPEVRTLREKTQLLSQGDQADLPHAGVSIRPTRSEPAPLARWVIGKGLIGRIGEGGRARCP